MGNRPLRFCRLVEPVKQVLRGIIGKKATGDGTIARFRMFVPAAASVTIRACRGGSPFLSQGKDVENS